MDAISLGRLWNGVSPNSLLSILQESDWGPHRPTLLQLVLDLSLSRLIRGGSEVAGQGPRDYYKGEEMTTKAGEGCPKA